MHLKETSMDMESIACKAIDSPQLELEDICIGPNKILPFSQVRYGSIGDQSVRHLVLLLEHEVVEPDVLVNTSDFFQVYIAREHCRCI